MGPHDAPELSAIPDEAKLYDSLLDQFTSLCGDGCQENLVEAAMRIFADHLRAQVAHFDRLAAGQPRQTAAGRAAGLAYQAAAAHLRARADELAGGA